MRNFVIILIASFTTSGFAQAQWYERHYGADRMGDLSFYQLKESTRKSVINIGIGAFSFAAGSVVMITGREKLESPGTKPFTDIFRSPESAPYAYTGAAIASAGTAVVLANTVRLVRIGLARNRMLAFSNEIEITPELRVIGDKTTIPGVSVVITF